VKFFSFKSNSVLQKNSNTIKLGYNELLGTGKISSFVYQFHQHFMRTFLVKIFVPQITKLSFGFETFWRQKKRAKKH